MPNPFEKEIMHLLGMNQADRFMSTKEIAEWLGMSMRWVQMHAKGQLLPKLEGIKLGPNTWKFRLSDVEKFLEETQKRVVGQ